MAVTQIGQKVQIALCSKEITGTIIQSFTKETTADINEVRDCNNDVVGFTVSNKGKRVTVEALIEDGNSFSEVTKGETMTIDSDTYLIEEARYSYSPLESKITITGYAPDGVSFA